MRHFKLSLRPGGLTQREGVASHLGASLGTSLQCFPNMVGSYLERNQTEAQYAGVSRKVATKGTLGASISKVKISLTQYILRVCVGTEC